VTSSIGPVTTGKKQVPLSFEIIVRQQHMAGIDSRSQRRTKIFVIYFRLAMLVLKMLPKLGYLIHLL
jgi:hypothetical protein